jgi:hypothetical protein
MRHLGMAVQVAAAHIAHNGVLDGVDEIAGWDDGGRQVPRPTSHGGLGASAGDWRQTGGSGALSTRNVLGAVVKVTV